MMDSKTEVEVETLKNPIEKGIISVPDGYQSVGPLIEEAENEGWFFADSGNQNGFTNLYFTRFKN